MSYNFVSDFWKINLLGKAIFFNQEKEVIAVTGEKLTLGPEDCIFIHNYGNEKNPIKPRPAGFLEASYIRKEDNKCEILDIRIPCECIQDYHTLETNQVFQYIDRIKEEYFESNKLLVSHNLKMIKNELAIDQQFMSSDFTALKDSLNGVDQDQEQFNKIFCNYAEDTLELINVLSLEQRIMQALLLKKKFQKKYFDENFKFGIDLQNQTKSLNPDNFGAHTIHILDHLVVIEPYLAHKNEMFIFEKITFQNTIETFIEQLKTVGKGWLPKCFIGLFSSVYFKNKYAYIYTDGVDYGYIIVESESLLSLPKHKPIISYTSFSKISLNAYAFIRKFSRLVDSFEDYQISNLAHFVIVLEHVSNLDLKRLIKDIKLFEFDKCLDKTPNIEHRLEVLENGEQRAIVAIRHLLLSRDKYGLMEFIHGNTGKDKLYTTYASNQLRINIDGLLVTTSQGVVEGRIKKVKGYGDVLFVELNALNRLIELKLPLDFLDQAERKMFRSLCLPVINGTKSQYVHDLFKSYQYIAQDPTNYEMYHAAWKLMRKDQILHDNFLITLKDYMAQEYAYDLTDPVYKKKFEDLLDSLFGIYGYSKLHMIKPNMVHLKFWNDVVEQIKILVEIHGVLLQKVVDVCKVNKLTPIALYRVEGGGYKLITDSKSKDDRYYQSEWVDFYEINDEIDEVSFIATITELPEVCIRIYEWYEHSINCQTRPVFFRNREAKVKYLAMLGKMPEWFDLIDQNMPLDLTTFRKIFNRIDRSVEYILVTGETNKPICMFKPFRMFMDGNTVMLEGHYIENCGVLMYLYAPDQNAREDVVQLLLTHHEAVTPEHGVANTIRDVTTAEALSIDPVAMKRLRPSNICEQLENIAVQEPMSRLNNLHRIVSVPMKTDLLNIDVNNFVYIGDIWTRN